MIWSRYQEAIFDAVSDTNESLIIEAVAGSGKTTTIVECVRRVTQDKSVVFLAFNKAIQTTLAGRVTAPNATCATLHSMGLRAWKRFICEAGGSLRVDGRKMWEIAREVMSWEERRRFGQVVKLAGLGKQIGIVSQGSQKLTGSFMRASSEVPCVPLQPPYPSGSRAVAKRNTAEDFKSDSGQISLADLPGEDEMTDSAVARGLVADTDDNWRDLMMEYDIDEDEVSLTLVRRLLSESIRRSQEVIDFDDMQMLPVVFNAAFDKYDVVFVDEAQDLNGIQHEIVARMLASGGRLVGVGDPNQSCYHFRGAMADSMEIMGSRFNCLHLPLSISYRCPKSVVQKAQTWVKTIEVDEQAKMGMVVEYPEHTNACQRKEQYAKDNTSANERMDGTATIQTRARDEGIAKSEHMGGILDNSGNLPTIPTCTCGGLQGGWLIKDFRPTDVLLCRLTRPLVETAFKLIRGRVPCRVLGRDIGQGLVGLVNKSKLPTDAQVSRFDDWLSAYERRESDKLRAKEEFAKLGLLQDKIATVRVFMDDLGDVTVGELIHEIESLFKDDGGYGKVCLSTIHRAKGLGFPRVFVLDADELQPLSWSADQGGEVNLQYVAATRSEQELYYIRSKNIR